MDKDLSHAILKEAVARSVEDRLEDLRNCHAQLSRKQAELRAAAGRGDVEAMRRVNEEMQVLSDLATACVASILAATNGKDVAPGAPGPQERPL